MRRDERADTICATWLCFHFLYLCTEGKVNSGRVVKEEHGLGSIQHGDCGFKSCSLCCVHLHGPRPQDRHATQGLANCFKSKL
jgi:hypothetical protein